MENRLEENCTRKASPKDNLTDKTTAAQGVFRGALAGVPSGLLLAIAGCAQHKEALPAEPCQVLLKRSSAAQQTALAPVLAANWH